jgi:hypothetical protein
MTGGQVGGASHTPHRMLAAQVMVSVLNLKVVLPQRATPLRAEQAPVDILPASCQNRPRLHAQCSGGLVMLAFICGI